MLAGRRLSRFKHAVVGGYGQVFGKEFIGVLALGLGPVHAVGKPVDFVEQAKIDGCLELGFSDHCPYPAQFNDCWPDVRMSVEQIPLYENLIEQARQEANFPVYFGFECEWDKEYESYYRDELKGKYGANYLVLGSHWLRKDDAHIYCPDIDNSSDLNKYIDQTIDGMGINI